MGPTARVLAIASIVALVTSGCVTDPDAGPPVATDEVRIPGAWVFEPAKIQVAAGTTVTWTNDGGQSHTITFEDLDIDKTIDPGGTVQIGFDAPGTYTYICRFHPPDMVGTVVVTDATASTSGSE